MPAHAPRDFQEALQILLVLPPGRDHRVERLGRLQPRPPGPAPLALLPKGLADGTLTREQAKELLECFFIKFNNHTAPAKQGVTAAESGTYTDFANINLAGLLPGTARTAPTSSPIFSWRSSRRCTCCSPAATCRSPARTPDDVLKHALRVIRKGYGFPSIFNADAVVEEQLRQGKTLEDAREGGCSGCVEVGAFGKEAYILTGYFNLVKMLELALHDGLDPRSGKQIGARTGDPADFRSFDDLFAAFETQLRHLLEIKIRGNQTHRAPVRHPHAPHLPVGAHRRLHPEGQGLQRRRRALQQHLHPGRGHRHASRTACPRSRNWSSTSRSWRLAPVHPDTGQRLRRHGNPSPAAA